MILPFSVMPNGTSFIQRTGEGTGRTDTAEDASTHDSITTDTVIAGAEQADRSPLDWGQIKLMKLHASRTTPHQ